MFKFLPKPPIPGLYHVILIFIVIYSIIGFLLNWLNNTHHAHVSELQQVEERQQIAAVSVNASRSSTQGLPAES